MQVIRADAHSAVCQSRNGIERIDTLRTGALQAGQWVLAALGSAREVIDAGRAAQVEDALTALDAILAGSGDSEALVNAHFADLVNREPQLPDFLRPAGERAT
jgi:hydrogenase expression/formation protein HypC